ncbi:MAG TPA: hypothetical protein VNE42_06905 [Acidimicrobiales bacterium]|nr:hypothetical protein [Acidimicrobiales bacterium]
MNSINSSEQDIEEAGAFDKSASVSEMFQADAQELDSESLEDLAGDGSVLERGRQMLAEAEAKLAGVERALARLDAGNYGLCEVCGAPIAATLLAEHPSLSRCAEHDQESASAS